MHRFPLKAQAYAQIKRFPFFFYFFYLFYPAFYVSHIERDTTVTNIYCSPHIKHCIYNTLLLYAYAIHATI